jgi:protein-tyrosine phosphatase
VNEPCNLGEVPGPLATVLCVCTANVSRSPAAELLLRAGLRRRLGSDPAAAGIRVRSAGTWASADRPIEPSTAAALRSHGIPGTELAAARSVPLRPDTVAAADLVLAATAEHVRGVWRLQLAARARTFTLVELATLSEQVPPAVLPTELPARLRALVAAADAVRQARRGPGGPWLSEAYDLADPFEDDLAQRDMVRQTAAAVDTLADLLAGRAGPPDRLPWLKPWSRSRTRRGASR